MKSVYCLFVFILFCFSSVNCSTYVTCEPGYYVGTITTCRRNEQAKELIDSLFKAAEFDDLETVKQIVESKRGILTGQRDDLTVLHIAAIGGSLNVIQYLVREQNFEINVIPLNRVFGLSPLGEAAKAGKLEAVKLLLELGANKDFTTYYNGYTLLHVATEGGDIEVCKFLLQTFHVDVRNRYGKTPAYLAARNGNVDALRFLLENGADPHARDSDNSTLIHAAVMSGQADVVRELTRYEGLINTPDKRDDLPIDIMSNMEVVEVLVDAGSNITDKCIWKYIGSKNIDVVKYLLEKSGKVNIQATWFTIPNCKRSLLTSLLEQRINYELIEFLLKQGEDVNTKDCRNRTVLTIVIWKYYEQDALAIVKLLLDRGADTDVNVRDEHGFTALDYAELKRFNKVARYLRKFGATTYPSEHCAIASACCFIHDDGLIYSCSTDDYDLFY